MDYQFYSHIGGLPSLVTACDSLRNARRYELSSSWQLQAHQIGDSVVDNARKWVRVPRDDDLLSLCASNLLEQCSVPLNNNSADSSIKEYSDEQYAAVEATLNDSSWTRDETDYLWSLCRQYDVRWFIIHDRYLYNGVKNRTLPDLQRRFYAVNNCLCDFQNGASLSANNGHYLKVEYNYENEMAGREYAQNMTAILSYGQSSEIVLLHELQALANQIQQVTQERDSIRRIFQADTFGMPNLGQLTAVEAVPKKRKKPKSKAAEPITVSTKPVPQDVRRSTSLAPSADGDNQSFVVPLPKKERKVTGVLVRSQSLPVARSQIQQQRVNFMLEELGVSVFPKMPTKQTCQLYDELIKSILHILDLQKQTEKLQNDLKVLSKSDPTRATSNGDMEEDGHDANQRQSRQSSRPPSSLSGGHAGRKRSQTPSVNAEDADEHPIIRSSSHQNKKRKS
ncbi:hypothetical protein MIR68_012150 [Amoeboaphelidium protococcarum]|nr:hypothetical protein MIR68_012150 [Amoeboaphelidium protococcarum]